MNEWADLESDMEEFLGKSVKKLAHDSAQEMLRNITQRAAKGEVGKTPVESGNLMANTVVSINRANNRENQRVDTTGVKTYNEGMAKVKLASPWDMIYIQNNTEYNINAEFEGWRITGPYQYFTTAVNSTFEFVEMLK